LSELPFAADIPGVGMGGDSGRVRAS